ncbi:ABC transporter permease [Dongshaea marina]|uniref:ABC transporter permease n=1 Tax=Dongshaea marina TaxID=2047966 RepID=UPI000D3ECA5A|nr:ABC transporter permease [Dongshaea marina]
MNEIKDISSLELLSFASLLLLPAIAFWLLGIGDLIKRLIYSCLRMTLQLVLIGIYLRYLFQFNNPWLNLGWLLLMISVTNLHIIKGAGLSLKKLVLIGQASLSSMIILTLALFLLMLVAPSPWYDARYLIPLGGMLLGNCLTANILSLERFFNGIAQQPERYLDTLMQGGTVYESSLPFMQDALRAASSPILSTLATTGLVSLPGMMTGQILGGAEPLVAAKYQLAIMLGIFISMTLSSILNLLLAQKIAFDPWGNLKPEIFVSRQS